MCLIKDNKPYYITEPHKPNNKKERDRIEKLGGSVLFNSKDWRINGTLSIARAFGDVDYQPLVTSDPDYFVFDLDDKEDYLILGINYLIII